MLPENPRLLVISGGIPPHTVESNSVLHLESAYFSILSQLPASGTGFFFFVGWFFSYYHRIHVLYFYLLLVGVYVFHVGKYNMPIDPMGLSYGRYLH